MNSPGSPHYTCPMHPAVQQPAPGACPECGMALEAPLRVAERYTCPMHPAVEEAQPGACPECGMALEPAAFSGERPPNPELQELKWRLLCGVVLAAPLLLLHIGGRWWEGGVLWPWLRWGQWALATLVVFGCGWPFFVRGWHSFWRRRLNMFSLISLGVGAAYGYSAFALGWSQWLPAALPGAEANPPLYFDSAAFIIVLTLLGQVLELQGRARSGDAIRALLRLNPPTAWRIAADGTEHEVPLAQVRRGDRLRIRPGAAVPVDGQVQRGHSAVDESLLSGEALPQDKAPGDALIGGSLNTYGSLEMVARKVGAATVLARMADLAAQAMRSRIPSMRAVDAVAAWFTPAVMLCAAGAFLGWSLWGDAPLRGLLAAVSVLIIACPCALGLAAPMSVALGVGRGARAGVLVRDADALARLARINAILMDKTGTLTQGRPILQQLEAHPALGEDQLLALTASVERASEHPIGTAFVRAATERGLPLQEVAAFEALPGQGLRAQVGDTQLLVGTAALLEAHGISTQAWQERTEALRRQGAVVVFMAWGARSEALQAGGFLAVGDSLKPTAAQAVEALQAAGLWVGMLSGDHPLTVQAVAQQLGLQQAQGGASPEEKVEAIKRLQAQGKRVLMAGDGVNDAPALAQADLGAAMDAGAAAAIASAQLTLIKGDVQGLLRALRLGRAVMQNIRQNLFLAFFYNSLGIPLAAGALYPWLGLQLTPTFAAAAMALSSVSVIANASRLARLKL